MRTHPGILLLAVLSLAACGRGIEVRTVVAPETRLDGLRSFRILPVPGHRTERPLRDNDPMLVNSISNRALREDIRRGLLRHGYAEDEAQPDFLVAFYASAKEKLDVTTWDYGYPWRPRWWRGFGGRPPSTTITEYIEGTVIIDVLDARSRELMWRGQGVSAVPDEQEKYVRALDLTVRAILERFPKQTGRP